MRLITLCAISLGFLIVFPSLSAPQDYRIAFVSMRSGEHGIYVMDAVGSGVKRLTNDKLALLMDGAWSPNGQRLTFYAVRAEDSELLSRYQLPFHFPLYIMDANGDGQKRILDVPVVPGARWSPDGKRILFTSSYEDPNRSDPEVRSGTRTVSSALYVLDVGTGEYKRITRVARTDLNAFASWSPDGTRIVFTCGRPPKQPREICIVNADGTHERQLTTRRATAVMPTWSPDVRHLAFVAAPRGPSDREGGVYMMDENGANQRRISGLLTSRVLWSPDGKSVLIRASRDTYIINVEGNGETKLSLGSGRVLDEVFSPDGRDVLYRCNEAGRDKIYAMNVDGSDRRMLSDNAGEESLFAVSPLLHH